MREFDRAAVVTIQGGGVYGLNLLGQLQYVVDQMKVTPLAIAGTSAGSIVATLYWAGLSPKEIRDKFVGLSESDGLTSLLGPFGDGDDRFDYSGFEQLAERLRGYVELARQRVDHGISVWSCLFHPVRTAKALSTARGEMAELMRHAVKRGFFAGEELERRIDQWIRNSARLSPHLRDLPSNRLLQFGDLAELANEGRLRLPPLFLTATNLTTRSLELINSVDTRYANVPIARAVRASAGFPAFFRSIKIDQLAEPGWFCDGGVISNFPAWVFSDALRQKLATSDIYAGLASRPWLHIGLRLVADPEPRHSVQLAPQEQLAAFAELLTGQARNELESAVAPLVARTILVNQPMSSTDGPDNLLAVDQLSKEKIVTMIQAGVDHAEKELQGVSFELPARDVVEPLLSKLVAKTLLVLNCGDEEVKLRANVFVIQRNALNLCYGSGMKGDPDEQMTLKFTTGLTGFCFTRRAPLLCNLEKIRELAEAGDLQPHQLFGMTKEEQHAVRSDRTWLASVPIFDAFAVYPGDLGAMNGNGRLPGGPHAHSLSSPIDGAVIGVLNLDSAFDYDDLGIDPDPAKHWTNLHIRAILDLMQASATEIGALLSNAFAQRRLNEQS